MWAEYVAIKAMIESTSRYSKTASAAPDDEARRLARRASVATAAAAVEAVAADAEPAGRSSAPSADGGRRMEPFNVSV